MKDYTCIISSCVILARSAYRRTMNFLAEIQRKFKYVCLLAKYLSESLNKTQDFTDIFAGSGNKLYSKSAPDPARNFRDITDSFSSTTDENFGRHALDVGDHLI